MDDHFDRGYGLDSNSGSGSGSSNTSKRHHSQSIAEVVDAIPTTKLRFHPDNLPGIFQCLNCMEEGLTLQYSSSPICKKYFPSELANETPMLRGCSNGYALLESLHLVAMSGEQVSDGKKDHVSCTDLYPLWSIGVIMCEMPNLYQMVKDRAEREKKKAVSF